MFRAIKYYDGTYDQEDFDKLRLSSPKQDGLMSAEDKAKLDSIVVGESGGTTEAVKAADVVTDPDHLFVTEAEKEKWNTPVEIPEAYVHPETHPATMIEVDDTHQFVTVEEKEKIASISTETEPIMASDVVVDDMNQFVTVEEKEKIGCVNTQDGCVIVKAENVVLDDTHQFVTVAEKEKWNTPVESGEVYVHPETHPATMITEDATHRFVTDEEKAAWGAHTEPYVHPETHPATMITEDETHRFMTDLEREKITALPNFANEPFYDETRNAFFACGAAVTLEASENTGMCVAKYRYLGQVFTIEFPEGISVFGGGLGTNEEVPYYPATCITVNSGKYKNINGGGLGFGNVGVTNVTINGGYFTEGINGGSACYVDKKEYKATVGLTNVVINDLEYAQIVYGGGQSMTAIGYAKMTVNGGNILWLTAGGSNGHTSNGEIVINGGKFTVVQGCNRGTMGNIKITVNGGEIERLYAGGETEDKGVTATYVDAEVIVNGGTIGACTAGTNGGVLNANTVHGEYTEGVITTEAAAAMNLVKAPLVITDVVLEGTNLIFKNGDTVVKTVVLS